jgi:SnoaL-like polyketide cyclase
VQAHRLIRHSQPSQAGRLRYANMPEVTLKLNRLPVASVGIHQGAFVEFEGIGVAFIAGPKRISDREQLLDFARRYTEAWCSWNAASVAAFCAPAGSLSVHGGTPAVGQAAIIEVAQSFMTAFPDIQVLMPDLVTLEHRAVYHWTLIDTNTGPGGLIAASRVSLDAAEYERQPQHGWQELV